MATPNTPANPIETARLPLADRRDASGAQKSGSAVDKWLNFALFSIGGVAAVGLVMILFGAYLVASDSLIVAGAAILSLATIAWILAALAMVGDLAWKLVSARGKRPRKSLPQ